MPCALWQHSDRWKRICGRSYVDVDGMTHKGTAAMFTVMMNAGVKWRYRPPRRYHFRTTSMAGLPQGVWEPSVGPPKLSVPTFHQ
jgi:hypothetical protein